MESGRVIANKRLMVVNRGEIATRVFRAATELNMVTVAIFSYEDRFSVHRFKADEAYQLGNEGKPLEAYLNWKKILQLAVAKNIDAIHPGYGFLSENPDFAAACEKHGILFCGPESRLLKAFGDKIEARKIALEASLPLIPGSNKPISTLREAAKLAEEIGFPITIKAVSGGGGKGIRSVQDLDELEAAFDRAKSEALSSFGRGDIYIEKTILNPKHIEVQIVSDKFGNHLHLYDRDCSIQRRHQKVVEVAPAPSIHQDTRAKILDASVRLAKVVGYVGVGTVEFLVSEDNTPYFLEVNPRIQVEHTITEMITGIDIVQASIMLAAGRPVSHPAIGINSQEDIEVRGVAIQCRITTEDPQKDFFPDTGKITAYRPAQGFGIRLDEGLGTSGGLVTSHYDSLLVKVTAHAPDLFGASRKMRRALKEFRIRGVKNNIPLLVNIVSHQKFITGEFTTKFLTGNKDLFKFMPPRDRATKLLKFIANTTINDPNSLGARQRGPAAQVQPPSFQSISPPSENGKKVFDESGAEGLKQWILSKNNLLLTDTTMRDAQQSLFATRLRTYDILKIADYYNHSASNLFSLEVWGGATFDTSLRFLKEDPWERLTLIRQAIPNCLLQMLLRGDNAVGYTNYPSWVVKDFIRLTRQSGLDLFRIFDCLNNVEKMQVAIDEVKNQGGIAEAAFCYTGNILDSKKTKYDINYYLEKALELKQSGADILAIKDMAGLLRPEAARILVSELKEKVELPIHLHTHDTAGGSLASLLYAAEAGCDIVDGAISSMSGLTSQPSLNALVASLENRAICPDIELKQLDKLAPYWEDIRKIYSVYDPGVKSSTTSVYHHEIPGGQYSNLYDQAKKVGVSSEEFISLTHRYQEVNTLLGDIIKVTPSSKVVGDFALLLQKSKITGSQLLSEEPKLDYPDSVLSFFKGHMGVPYGGFPEKIRRIVLGSEAKKAPQKPPENNLLRATVIENVEKLTTKKATDQQIITYALYPKVFADFIQHKEKYGEVSKIPTTIFLHGLLDNEEISVEIETGKTLIISLNGFSEPNDKGIRKVFFSLNGFPREVEIEDSQHRKVSNENRKADPGDLNQVAAIMPGKVLESKVQVGDSVNTGDTLFITESMKMEYIITAKHQGTISEVITSTGAEILAGDLLCILDSN